MLSTQLRIVLIIAVLLYFAIILKLLKDKALSLKYTLLWIFAGIVMGGLLVFPSTLSLFVKVSGIQTPMYALLVFGLAFVIVILMSLTSIVSRQSRKIHVLVQEIAIMEKRIREIENRHEIKS